MTGPATPSELDAVLALQLTVAWAGEGICDPPRLGWWSTDLLDRAGGGGFLERLLPRTHAWAALRAVREAARLADERARVKMGGEHTRISLFHFGFDDDERLDERLEHHRRTGLPPREALPSVQIVFQPFDRQAFERQLEQLKAGARYEVIPDGRKLRAEPASLDAAAVELARALLPLSAKYPFPFFERVTR